jgi:hypothetical protein
MKAPKFVVIAAADEAFLEHSEHTIEMKRYEFRSFAAAWKFAQSLEFALQFDSFITKARKQFDRPMVECYIMLGSLVCASIEADSIACSAWSRHYSL